MTFEERDRPEIIDGSRRSRIARLGNDYPRSKPTSETVQGNQKNDERHKASK